MGKKKGLLLAAGGYYWIKLRRGWVIGEYSEEQNAFHFLDVDERGSVHSGDVIEIGSEQILRKTTEG